MGQDETEELDCRSWIETDQDSYAIGDPIVITYQICERSEVTLVDHMPDGRMQAIPLGVLDAGTHSLTATISEPAGAERVELWTAPEGGTSVLAASATFEVLGEDEESLLPEDVYNAVARLGYVMGEEASPSEENWTLSERRFRSKSDVKYHLDIWQAASWRGTWMQEDAYTIERFLMPAAGDAAGELIDLWQYAFDLGYQGGCFSCVFGFFLPSY